MNDNMLDPRLRIGGNLPPEPIDVDVAIDDLIGNANRWAARCPVIETEEVAKDAIDQLNKLKAHRAEYEALRKAEKKPFDDGALAVQRKWLPRTERIDACIKLFDGLRRGWLNLQEAARLKAEREAAEAAFEAQRRADQLAEQAKAGGAHVVTNTILGMEAAAEAERAREALRAVPRRAQVRGNLGGRTHSLRTYWFADVVDWQKCFDYFHEPEDRGDPNSRRIPVRELREVLISLANAKARTGVRNPDLPGCWIDFEEK